MSPSVRHPTAHLPRAPAVALRQLLDQLLIGVILTDASGKSCYANREAREILARQGGLTIGPEGLTATRFTDTRRLRHALAMTASAAQDSDATPRARYLALSGHSRHASPLLLRLSALAGPPPRVAVFITEPEHLQPVPREAIAVAFGLTPREADLASLLADGHELRDCARLLAMGEGTARNHLKHVFEKTVKHRQAALVAELCRITGPCR